MKKNMVIFKPLFIFSLITCVSLSSMDKPLVPSIEIPQPSSNSNQLSQELQNFIPFQKLKERHASGEYTEEYTQSQKNVDLVENISLTESTHETTKLELPDFKDTYVTIDNPLLESVMLPTEEKDVSFLEWVSYKTSTAQGHLHQMINYLKKGQFDSTNLTHLNWLDEAVATATKSKDIQSLLTIADLNEKKYANQIRISPSIAQSASALLNSYYAEQVTTVDQELLKERQKEMIEWNTINAACTKAIYEQIMLYNQNMQSISKKYDAAEKQQLEHISDLQRKMKAFSVLNREIRQETTDLIKNNQVKMPKHIFATTMKQTEKKLTAIQKTLEEIPSIQTAQGNPKYVENLLNFNNK